MSYCGWPMLRPKQCIFCWRNFTGGISGYWHRKPFPFRASARCMKRLLCAPFEHRRALFLYMPNLHRLHHLQKEMQWQATRCKWVMNPLAYACQADEDYIGKPSRLSRRVSPKWPVRRTLRELCKRVLPIMWTMGF